MIKYRYFGETSNLSHIDFIDSLGSVVGTFDIMKTCFEKMDTVGLNIARLSNSVCISESKSPGTVVAYNMAISAEGGGTYPDSVHSSLFILDEKGQIKLSIIDQLGDCYQPVISENVESNIIVKYIILNTLDEKMYEKVIDHTKTKMPVLIGNSVTYFENEASYTVPLQEYYKELKINENK